MKKIVIMGVSAGVGKSTFAVKLGKELSLPVYHLDAYYWKPGWVEAEPEEFRSVQESIVKTDKWIVEGNYTATADIRLSEADTMIYLELPLIVCVYRVLKRWLTNLGRTRADVGEDCPEKMDAAFLKFIFTTYSKRKVKMRERMRSFQNARPENTVIFLASQKQIDSFFNKKQEN
ncbi:topology modulation protein [Planococcus shixiaomingii]|uniref:topology modulation protein n=1 Tax=Planococcus shixiaomingii TaxID=3058393 RepID=UPI00262F6BA6|nr:topology modulation protein [Planococcus sp. N022]WKA55203.1 topology modulation protein [Planococcus sp. N022]